MRSSRVKLAENHLNIKHLITVTKWSAAHARSANIAPTSEMLIRLEKVCLILPSSSRGEARLYFPRGAGLLLPSQALHDLHTRSRGQTLSDRGWHLNSEQTSRRVCCFSPEFFLSSASERWNLDKLGQRFHRSSLQRRRGGTYQWHPQTHLSRIRERLQDPAPTHNNKNLIMVNATAEHGMASF